MARHRDGQRHNANPVRDVQPVRSKSQPKGAVALTADQLRNFLLNLQTSEFCEKHDLVDPITLLIATGIRRSELLALRWSDVDEKTDMLTVVGKVIRVPREGLMRVDETKSAAGRRTFPCLGEQTVIFPSTAGTLRDPNNFVKLWRSVRGTRRVGCNYPQLPQDRRHPHRRRRSLRPNRSRPPRPQPCQHDPGPLHDPQSHPYPGRRPVGSRRPHKR